MIEFKQVYYSYDAHAAEKEQTPQATQADWGNAPESVWALEDVSFTLQDGELFGIAGHTGSGKSTLVQHMNGLLNPTHGQVLVDGLDIANKQAAAEVRGRVGLVFQYPEHQLFAASVFEDVAFGPRNMGVAESELESVVRDALALVDLDYDVVGKMSPFELSGGQQRRVALAGVLAMQPSTLILDEPAAGLDPAARRELLALVQRLHKENGNTIVLISHNMDDLAALCDHVLVLNKGCVHALGSPTEVFSDAIAMKDIGLDVPAAQRVAAALAEQGIVLQRPSVGLFTPESLVQAIVQRYKEGS